MMRTKGKNKTGANLSLYTIYQNPTPLFDKVCQINMCWSFTKHAQGKISEFQILNLIKNIPLRE